MGQWSSAVGATSVCPSGGDRQAHFMFYQPVKTTRCCKAWPASNTTASVRERRRSPPGALTNCACRDTQHGSVGDIRQPPPRGYPATGPAGPRQFGDPANTATPILPTRKTTVPDAPYCMCKHMFLSRTYILPCGWYADVAQRPYDQTRGEPAHNKPERDPPPVHGVTVALIQLRNESQRSVSLRGSCRASNHFRFLAIRVP